jgi:superfamily II DNA or RNA helicase
LSKISIVTNAISGKLLGADKEAKEIVTECLSYFVFGYENTYSYKNDKWDGRSTMFDWDTCTFPIGFLGAVNAHLTAKGYKVTNIAKSLPKPLGTLPRTLGGFEYTDKYDYQWKLVSEFEKRGIMIARLATGAGKTFAAALCCTRINRPTLILTKRTPLLHQFVERLEDFGFSPGVIGDTKADIKPDLTVAMAQTLVNRLDDPEVIKYLNTIEFVIGEEAHEISDDSYWRVVRRCPNAYYKLALTATPFMKDKSEANMKLMAAFGPVGIDVNEKLLIDRGVNATPKIKFLSYDPPSKCKFNSNYQKAVEFGITRCDTRNSALLKEALEAKRRGLPMLTLISRQEHGRVLEELFNSNGIETKFIFGESTRKKRRQALKELSNGTIDALIGSTILDVGIDVPMIALLVIAGGGKAEVGYRQRIGRGLRSKATGPNICMVVDFADEHNIHLFDHYRERLKIIRETKGFSENLLGEHEPLPWSLFD